MTTFKNSQGLTLSVVFMRIFIGWHFLYEGVIKAYNPEWTSKGYLASAEGWFQGFFQWLSTDGLVGTVDTLNIVVLLFVGFTLVLGVLEKPGAIAGILLLFMYYLAHPAFPGMNPGVAEGSYWIINKNLIELAALAVLFHAPTGSVFGLDRLFKARSNELKTSES
ncbi:MAG: DoxX family membrane protein [Bacteroidota bacterium]